ncbi:phosphate acyltransferase PlsX [Desulfurivibrio dismutans]|uniref:phosphate acyltransferase PlsX n=1 Tax=Desulfurivibrio dismutans TaxID=1398908 RepID=UPI0023DA3FB1|nr:phosphate acyltransferase PlsX [Desulfurivibrio alkaliphilus]MDF1613625.1 phosphate acyltransferase PlsX [Desulfurivibrio alkaliphilus]
MSGKLRIALDAMGGDRGPEEMVAGAVLAARQDDLSVTLLGDQARIETAIADCNLPAEVARRLDVVPTTQVVGMDESPFEAIRRKKDSSIMRAFALHKEGKVDAVVSAGNSGATMAAGLKYLGRLENISRPGIANSFPTMKGPVVMMDVGANVDCRPRHLFEFGVMAAAFARVLSGIERPRIGLLNIGEEGGKGNLLVRHTHYLFQQSSLNYIGNVEGQQTFQGDIDVIVCDGFVGNVCLKLSEGLAEVVVSMLGDEIRKRFLSKVGYLLARDAFAAFRRRVDYAEYGGAPLLGLQGTGVICHGRSSDVAIKNAIRVASEMVRNRVNDHIISLLAADDFLAKKAEAAESEQLPEAD